MPLSRNSRDDCTHESHERITVNQTFWKAIGSLFPMKTYKNWQHNWAKRKRRKERKRNFLYVKWTQAISSASSDIDKLTDELCEIDHDWERSATAKRGVMACMRPYRDILIERKKSRQSTLHAFFKNVTILKQGLRQRTNAASLRHCRL